MEAEKLLIELSIPSLAVWRLLLIDPGDWARLWLDWRHDTETYGVVELEGNVWSEPTYHTWTDDTWLGREMIRRVIRHDVIRGFRNLQSPVD